MDDRGWDKIVDAIDAKFGVTKHGKTTEPLEDQPELTRNIAFIEFDKGGRHFKMERVARPAIVDRKTFHHRAAASKVRHENIYDPEATAFQTNIYEQRAGDWQPIDPSELAL